MSKPAAVWATLLLLLATVPGAYAAITIDPDVEIQAGSGVFTFTHAQNVTTLSIAPTATTATGLTGADGGEFDTLGFTAASGSNFNVTEIRLYQITLVTMGLTTTLITPTRTTQSVTGSTSWTQAAGATNATSLAGAVLNYNYVGISGGVNWGVGLLIVFVLLMIVMARRR